MSYVNSYRSSLGETGRGHSDSPVTYMNVMYLLLRASSRSIGIKKLSVNAEFCHNSYFLSPILIPYLGMNQMFSGSLKGA